MSLRLSFGGENLKSAAGHRTPFTGSSQRLWSSFHVSVFIMEPERSIAVHQCQFQMTVWCRLFLPDAVFGIKHLADFKECFVLGFWNDKYGVQSNSPADRAEDQVTVWTCSFLKRNKTKCFKCVMELILKT